MVKSLEYTNADQNSNANINMNTNTNTNMPYGTGSLAR